MLAGTEHHRGVLEREPARLGQPQARGMTFEQRDTERALERSHLLADRRLRDSQPRGSTCNGAFERSDVKIVEVVVVQHEVTRRVRSKRSSSEPDAKAPGMPCAGE